MSNDFDKEVAAKIADRAIAEDKKESEEKYGKSLTEEVWIGLDELKYEPCFTMKDMVWGEPQTNNLPEKEELSKIDFYRQKVQQYEAVENLMESIKCEIDDTFVTQEELQSDYYSDDDILWHTYQDMIDAYKECYAILEKILKDI